MNLLVNAFSNIWTKSSYSGSEVNCVEVAHRPDRIGVRDSKIPHATHLEFRRDGWAAFLYQVKLGLLD